MALQLRPNCEYCDKDLPPNATDARICSYECTFCADCVENKLHNVCPNCGGGFAPRPIRPATERRPGVCVTKQLPSDKRVHLKYSVEDVAAHSCEAAGYSAGGSLSLSTPSLPAANAKRLRNGAQRRSNPSFRSGAMDCFASLAMTGRERHSAARIVPSTSPKPTR